MFYVKREEPSNMAAYVPPNCDLGVLWQCEAEAGSSVGSIHSGHYVLESRGCWDKALDTGYCQGLTALIKIAWVGLRRSNYLRVTNSIVTTNACEFLGKTRTFLKPGVFCITSIVRAMIVVQNMEATQESVASRRPGELMTSWWPAQQFPHPLCNRHHCLMSDTSWMFVKTKHTQAGCVCGQWD